jgi:hypothetical protein
MHTRGTYTHTHTNVHAIHYSLYDVRCTPLYLTFHTGHGALAEWRGEIRHGFRVLVVQSMRTERAVEVQEVRDVQLRISGECEWSPSCRCTPTPTHSHTHLGPLVSSSAKPCFTLAHTRPHPTHTLQLYPSVEYRV